MRLIIADPITFSVYELKYRNVRRTILIFGEWHKKKTPCPFVTDKNVDIITFAAFLEWYGGLFPDSIIDVLTESVYPVPSKLEYRQKHAASDWDYGLGFLRDYLDRCAPKFRRREGRSLQCPDNIRVHLCDVRLFASYPIRGLSQRDRPSEPFWVLSTYFEFSNTPVGTLRTNPSLYKRFHKFWEHSLFNPSSDFFVDHIFDLAMVFLKITRQFDHIGSGRIRIVLMDWGISEWHTQLERVRKLFGSLTPKNVQSFGAAVIDMNTVFMDMYLMGRLLRTFSDGSMITHAVLYTGEYHSHHYRQILERLGATRVYTTLPQQHVPYTDSFLASLPPCVDITPYRSWLETRRRRFVSKN